MELKDEEENEERKKQRHKVLKRTRKRTWGTGYVTTSMRSRTSSWRSRG